MPSPSPPHRHKTPSAGERLWAESAKLAGLRDGTTVWFDSMGIASGKWPGFGREESSESRRRGVVRDTRDSCAPSIFGGRAAQTLVAAGVALAGNKNRYRLVLTSHQAPQNGEKGPIPCQNSEPHRHQNSKKKNKSAKNVTQGSPPEPPQPQPCVCDQTPIRAPSTRPALTLAAVRQ